MSSLLPEEPLWDFDETLGGVFVEQRNEPDVVLDDDERRNLTD